MRRQLGDLVTQSVQLRDAFGVGFRQVGMSGEGISMAASRVLRRLYTGVSELPGSAQGGACGRER